MIQCKHKVFNRKPDIVVLDKEERSCIIIDIACPRGGRVLDKKRI